MRVNRPVEFPGTVAERVLNFDTHDFDFQDNRCRSCDCRPWGLVAEWPCGTADIPREDVEVGTNEFGEEF